MSRGKQTIAKADPTTYGRFRRLVGAWGSEARHGWGHSKGTMTDIPVADRGTVQATLAVASLRERPLSTSQIEEYRRDVERKRLERSDEIIYNNSSDHAAVLIEQLFLAGKRHVKIVCKRLNPASYGDSGTLTAAASFLSRSSENKIEVYVRDICDGANNPFVRRFGKRQQVSIKELRVPAAFDFMVVDGIAYRYEPDAHGASKALANFRDPDMAERLDGVFERVRQLIDRRRIVARTVGA